MFLNYILKPFKDLYEQFFCIEIDTTSYNKILIVDNFDDSYKNQLATSLQTDDTTVYLYDDLFNDSANTSETSTTTTIDTLLKKDKYIVSIQYAKNNDVPYHVDKLIEDCDLILYLDNNKMTTYLKCIYNYLCSYSYNLKETMYTIYKNYDLKRNFTHRNLVALEKSIIVHSPYYLESKNN